MLASVLPEELRLVVSVVILVAMFVAFVREWLTPSAVATIGAASYLLFGFVDEERMLATFSNPAVIAIAGMLVLSAALVRTGTLEALATRIVALASTRPRLAVIVLLGVALVASAFLNSTPVVVILIPLVAALAVTIGASAKKLLIPLSYVAILGGTCTLLGTSTSLLVNSIARRSGHPGFGIFDITPVGLCAAAAGIGFMLVGARRLLPGDGPGGEERDPEEALDIITECRVTDDFPELGTSRDALALLAPRGIRLIDVRRSTKRPETKDAAEGGAEAGRDEAKGAAPGAPDGIGVGDVLVLRVTRTELATLQSLDGLVTGLRVRVPAADVELSTRRYTIVNNSPLDVVSAARAPFLRSHAISLTGVRRHRVLAGPDLRHLVLRHGDLLWLEGGRNDLAEIAGDAFLVPSSMPPAKAFRRHRAAHALSTLALVIACATFGLAPLPVAAVIGIGYLLAIGGLDSSDAWAALDLDTLVLIYAMLIVGAGLESTGAVDAAVAGAMPLLKTLPPAGVVLVLYFLTSTLTEAVTNNGVAVIMTPIALGLAEPLGVHPEAMLAAVLFAASASFATPVGYQTNTLVHVSGNYRFSEFLRIGVPMNLVVGLVTSFAIVWWFG